MTETPLFPWWKAVTLDEMRHGISVIETAAEYNASADEEHQMGMQSILMAISPAGPSHKHDKAMAMAVMCRYQALARILTESDLLVRVGAEGIRSVPDCLVEAAATRPLIAGPTDNDWPGFEKNTFITAVLAQFSQASGGVGRA